ncbi:MAG: RNA polymerase sigma factor [Verrucomicrobia bacterium]|nr:MAG: RNA polymerase sigma factor [Verrucomicrobiota bacterium]
MHDEVFTALVDDFYAPLYRFALSLARNSADACDLTQQTFYPWATKGHMLRDRSKVKTWLFTTLYREFLRSRKRNSRMQSLEDLSPAEQDPPDIEPEKVENLDHNLVMDVLQEVDETFRAPLTLFYLKDLSYKEIAEILDVPIGTVMSRLSRGKAHLRSALQSRLAGSKVVEFPRAKNQ